MESDPYLALAEDSRRFGNIHKPVTQTEVLAEAVSQFKQAIGEAQKQVILNQKLSLSLSNELEIKDRLLEEEKKTTDRLIEVTPLDEFYFRWFEIKGIDAGFPISIMLSCNHLK